MPDFVVLDISLDGPDGLELLKTLRAKYPNLPVLILSMHDESAMQSGRCAPARTATS